MKACQSMAYLFLLSVIKHGEMVKVLELPLSCAFPEARPIFMAVGLFDAQRYRGMTYLDVSTLIFLKH